MDPLNVDLLTQTLNFHGQQLQKVWEAERGEQDLIKHNIKDLNFQVYGQRQKYLSFQDRGKRLKLQQFIVKKANQLFSQDILRSSTVEPNLVTEDMHAIMPPFETYINVDKQSRLKYFFETVRIGSLILGTIVSKTQSGMMLKVLCTVGTDTSVHYVADINVKAFCPVANVIPAVDRKGVTRSYMMNDSVCCEVLEVIPDTDKMVCGMKGTTRQPNDPEHRPALGLIGADDFPLVYKKALEHKGESYDAVLEKSVGFNNPNNISYLSELMGINSQMSFMTGLAGRFPEPEYSHELRQVQASKWAYRNVADGIDHFKAGRHSEAFQCLNKALNIDPKNVEGLVARGALYANSGNFQKAIEDFETALKLNPSHANARKYMGETLIALGRSYEEENKVEEARKAYQSCLSIIPFHEEAQNSLEFLKSKLQNPKNLIEPGDLLLPNLGSVAPPVAAVTVNPKSADVNDTLKQLLKNEEEDKKDKKKKKKTKKRKNRRRSSSSSSSSSSGSNESSSSSSSSSSDSSSSSGDSDFKKRKKHRSRSHRREKQSSLSPLSKRMALMDPTHDTSASYQFNKPAASTSFDFAFEQPQEQSKSAADEYEQKVKAFLDQTKGDSDYEEKVRKFLEESTRWRKEKKAEDGKKKKKKKEKKAKKESKKKRKEKKLKRKHFDLSELEDLENKKLRDALKKELGIKDKRSKRHGNSDDEDYLLQKAGYSRRFLDSLPDLEELESKLNAYYALEKESKRSESSKRSMGLDSPSPSREQKARQAVAEATASANASGAPTKWKMQIGNATAGSSRFKKKPEREDWSEEQMMDKRMSNKDLMEESNKKSNTLLPPADKSANVRKGVAMKDAPPPAKKEPELPLKKIKPPPIAAPQPKNMVPPGQVVLDKFGNFRLLSPRMQPDRSEDLPPLPPGAPPKDTFSGNRKPPEPPGRPRSGSRSSRRSRSRSRRKYSRSRSSSGSRSRSRSYRSRSRSYYSRSRSRSGSYYSRSRSRSRSYSGERRRYRRGGFRGGRYGDRGTYYKPRLPPRGGGYSRGRGNYYRDSRDGYRDYRGRGRPYNNRGGRRPRGRFGRGGYRDYRDRRYDRSRSRDRSRSLSGSRDRESVDTMRKVNAEKDKINKYLDNDGEPIRHEGPLSEGEDRDDYSTEKYVDRESYDGKWGEKGGGDNNDKHGKSIPNETNLEEMDKFLDKAKKDKKEEMLERNKEFLKDKS